MEQAIIKKKKKKPASVSINPSNFREELGSCTMTEQGL